MAKIVKIETETETQAIGASQSIWKIVLLGLILGLAYWGLTALIEKYVITQLFCQLSQYSLTCSQTLAISGNISTILVAIIGVVVMIKLNMAQPLIVAIASAATLWGLALLSAGLGSFEVIIWEVLVYGIAYALYSWIARCRNIIIVLVLIALMIFIVRTVITV